MIVNESFALRYFIFDVISLLLLFASAFVIVNALKERWNWKYTFAIHILVHTPFIFLKRVQEYDAIWIVLVHFILYTIFLIIGINMVNNRVGRNN